MTEETKGWFCYMARCADGSLYVGIAKDAEGRVKKHNWGVATEFTARRGPLQLVWKESYRDAAEARRREKELKGWSREKKMRLIAGLHPSPVSRAQGKGE